MAAREKIKLVVTLTEKEADGIINEVHNLIVGKRIDMDSGYVLGFEHLTDFAETLYSERFGARYRD